MPSVTAPMAAPVISTAPPAVVIPKVTWTSAPPPIPPRSFSTEPPPPESAPLTPVVVPPTEDLERLKLESVHRAHEIRDEARALLRQTLDEAMAPLHYELLELKRRLEELEKRPIAAPTPSPARVAVAAPMATGATTTLTSPRAVDPFVPPAPAPIRARQPTPIGMSAASRHRSSPMIEVDTSAFDGSKRARRVRILFGLLLVLLIGGLLIAMISSRVPVSH